MTPQQVPKSSIICVCACVPAYKHVFLHTNTLKYLTCLKVSTVLLDLPPSTQTTIRAYYNNFSDSGYLRPTRILTYNLNKNLKKTGRRVLQHALSVSSSMCHVWCSVSTNFRLGNSVVGPWGVISGCIIDLEIRGSAKVNTWFGTVFFKKYVWGPAWL